MYLMFECLNCTPFLWIGRKPGVSFTKICDASYNQLTHRRSHEVILLMNCYIALGCVAHALPCVASCYATRCKLHWYARIRRTNSMYEHLCERPPGALALTASMIYWWCSLLINQSINWSINWSINQSISYPSISSKICLKRWSWKLILVWVVPQHDY